MAFTSWTNLQRLVLHIGGFTGCPSPFPLFPLTSLDYFEADIPFEDDGGFEHVTAILTSSQSTIASLHIRECKAPLLFAISLISTVFPRLVHFHYSSARADSPVPMVSPALHDLLFHLRLAETVTINWHIPSLSSFPFIHQLPCLRLLTLEYPDAEDPDRHIAVSDELSRHRGAVLRVDLVVFLEEWRLRGENWLPLRHHGLRLFVETLEGTKGSDEADFEVWAICAVGWEPPRQKRVFPVAQQL